METSNERATQMPGSDRQIVVVRTVNAPIDLVWDAWTDPAKITHWWGPEGFSTTTSVMNLVPGGTWLFVMHGPDGVDYQNKVTFIEVVRPTKLVYRHQGVDETAHIQFIAEVRFRDLSGRTEITLQTEFETTEERNRVEREVGAVDGARQTLDRFAVYVQAS